MGKRAQYVKRGTVTAQGYLTAPTASEWSLGTPGSGDIVATRSSALPAGADRWGVMAIQSSNNVPVPVNVSTSTTVTVTPLNPVTAYRAVAAWFSTASNRQVSDWSSPKTFTTLT